MYFPFLRGKQFELLALRESAVDLAASRKVHPVIEPVRDKPDALARCLQVLAETGVPSTVIINPSEGDMRRAEDAPGRLLQVIADSPRPDLVRPGIMVTANADVAYLRRVLEVDDAVWGPTDLAHVDFVSDLDFGTTVTDESHQFVASKDILRRYDTRPLGRPVKWTDPFPRRERNLEYVDAEPTLFTDDTVYFGEDGFYGFADYATIGGLFAEGGGAPRAVIIHITYPDEQRRIWVRHFASDSNADTADPAGKFFEAVTKVAAFADAVELENPAMDAFRRHARIGSYPGLGVTKKLSIQNHLYVVMEVLAR